MLYLHEAVSMGNKMLCSPDGEQSTQYCKLHALSALFSAFRHKLDNLSKKGAVFETFAKFRRACEVQLCEDYPEEDCTERKNTHAGLRQIYGEY